MTGGMICSVAVCKNNSKTTKESTEKLKFHRFPKDPHIKKEWVRKSYRKDKFNPENKRICSKHFKPDDYEDEMQARLMGSQLKKLKKTAIPSLHIHLEDKNEEVNILSKRTRRMQQKQKKTLVEDLLQQSGEFELTTLGQTQVKDMNISCSKDTEDDIIKRKLEALERENIILKEKIQIHENNESKLQNIILELEKQLKKDDDNFEKTAKIAFQDILTSNQIEIALKKKTKPRWTSQELSKAFTLRYFSKRCYIYLRQTLHYPLPGLSTLQQWAVNINLRNGILEDVLKVMDTVGKIKNNFERTTVLTFDEVKISSLYEYDQKADEIVGPHSYLQVIMARGIFSNWKQPIYIGFDEKVTKNLLENVITRLHGINYDVVACTSDCGGGNQGLWKELNINIHKTFSTHPITERPIYFFADVPHLLKLLRNWFVDTGFLLSDGTSINKHPVVNLIETTNSEISSCHKLTVMHINCEKTQRQNVKLAAQLFSHTTATALKHYLPGDDQELAKNVGNFLSLINNWFDIMNSFTPSASVPSKKPYGVDLELQNEVLEKTKATIGSMACTGKKGMQTFQKGILMSTKSLQGLFEDFQEKLHIRYILTHRLNQDCLENFFSQLRTRGGLHDHPSPMNALYRIRMILLGKNPGIVQAHTNVGTPSSTENEEYLLANALRRANIKNISLPNEDTDVYISDNESSISSISTISTDSGKELSEKDGLQYIAGYLAKKTLKRISPSWSVYL